MNKSRVRKYLASLWQGSVLVSMSASAALAFVFCLWMVGKNLAPLTNRWIDFPELSHLVNGALWFVLSCCFLLFLALVIHGVAVLGGWKEDESETTDQ